MPNGWGYWADRNTDSRAILPEPSTSKIEVTIGKLKRYKWSRADQIPAELVQAEGDITF
jgi:hypothetical protein